MKEGIRLRNWIVISQKRPQDSEIRPLPSSEWLGLLWLLQVAVRPIITSRIPQHLGVQNDKNRLAKTSTLETVPEI